MNAIQLNIYREPDRAIVTLVGEHEGYAARKRAESKDGELEVVVGDETGWPVLRLLDLTGLASVLGVVRR